MSNIKVKACHRRWPLSLSCTHWCKKKKVIVKTPWRKVLLRFLLEYSKRT